MAWCTTANYTYRHASVREKLRFEESVKPLEEATPENHGSLCSPPISAERRRRRRCLKSLLPAIFQSDGAAKTRHVEGLDAGVVTFGYDFALSSRLEIRHCLRLLLSEFFLHHLSLPRAPRRLLLRRRRHLLTKASSQGTATSWPCFFL